MAVTAQAWFMTGGERRDIRLDGPPACGVAEPEQCRVPPRWTVTSLVNRTGLPGLGTEQQSFACALHLHRVAETLSEDSVSGAHLTPYGG